MSDFNSLTASQKYSHLNNTVMNMLTKPSWGWWTIFAVDMLFLAFGIYCFIYQIYTGLGVAGYSLPVTATLSYGVFILLILFFGSVLLTREL